MTTPIELVRMLYRARILRFIAAGAVNTLFGYAVYLVGLAAGMTPEIALLVATAVGAVWNYFTVARFVFSYRGFGRLPIFVASYGLVYVVNALAIRLVLDLGASPALAQALLLPLIAAFSFVLFRTFVFKAEQPT